MTVEEFTEIYNRYRYSVLNYANNKLNKNIHLAEDVTSYVFMRLWESHPLFENDRHISIWLIRATSNKIIDTYRSGDFKYRSRIPIENIEVTDNTAIDKHISDRDILHRIFEIEKALPPRQKELFQLCFMQELPSKEAAQILHTADQSVRNQLLTIRNKIRATLSRK